MQNSACLTTFLSAMLVGLNVFSGSCIPKADWSEIYFLSKLSLPFYAFVFTSAVNMLLLPGLYTCAKKRSVAKSDENIIVEGERSIKAVEKDHSTTIVASVRSTGAIVVGSINVTEFWQVSFTTARSQNGSCNATEIHSSSFFATITFVLASFTDVLYSIGKASN